MEIFKSVVTTHVGSVGVAASGVAASGVAVLGCTSRPWHYAAGVRLPITRSFAPHHTLVPRSNAALEQSSVRMPLPTVGTDASPRTKDDFALSGIRSLEPPV